MIKPSISALITGEEKRALELDMAVCTCSLARGKLRDGGFESSTSQGCTASSDSVGLPQETPEQTPTGKHAIAQEPLGHKGNLQNSPLLEDEDLTHREFLA